MITTANLKQLLSLLGYKEVSPKHFKKEFEAFDCCLEVDFEAKKIIYPQDKGLKVNDDTTSNFEHPENFVVFECVNRLLEKGYRPEHIELEKKWLLGHDAKSGKADICVYDTDGESMLLIIECKTYGKEYKNALKILRTDGGQLFSYWQQERSTKWVSLYASDIVDEQLVYENDIISCSDDANLKLLSKKDDSLKLYSNAHSVGSLFEAWKETYIMKLWQGLIFGEDSIAYKIGVKPLRKKDLKDFAPDDKIVNKFEEILRHNNVSDKENAFNRLVALFICKLVDEIRKGDNDEVEFQYKQGTDTYESLQDRLQRLHQAGMEDFMGEKIFYVPADYPEWLFTTYTGSQRKRAIEDLKEKIKILKFYSNNDFSFKDVHNEELFLQNGKILVEVVQLFEKYRIVYPSKHQFLGDLFEQLLNKGFKQNEGQFFTPMPITRFIWDSLPLKEYVSAEGSMRHPKVIDYACGAGHFLTEAVEAINSIIPSHGNNDWVRDCIYGIEKDYRLARVAKISMFMNGAGEANIIFGDGLDNTPAKKIENGTFDILVANPPYSVAAFKPHLKLKNNELLLLDCISNDGSDIEALFVERISQLLKPKGIAAVILPVTFLTNKNSSYIGAREVLFKNFNLRSIVLLGGSTFSETNTETAIVFIEKYNEPPKQYDLMEDCVDAIIHSKDIDDWIDNGVFDAYLTNIGISKDEYYSILDGSILSANNKPDYANIYINAFESSSEWIKRTSSKTFIKQSIEEKSNEKINRFVKFVVTVEKDKLLYFALTFNQSTLIITAPENNAEQKLFLGYSWSGRKGSEGIIVNKNGGLLCSAERWSSKYLSAAVRNSFLNSDWIGGENISKYIKIVRTNDLLDFSREKFDKSIKTAIESRQIQIISKYPLEELHQLVDIIRGVSYSKQDQIMTRTDVVILTADNITLDGKFEVTKEIFLRNDYECDSTKQLKANDTFICMSSGSRKHIGKVAFIDNDTSYYAGGFMGIVRVKQNRIKDLNPKFLYELLNSSIIKSIIASECTGSNLRNLSSSIENIAIPVPPMDIQMKLVKECNTIDAEYNNSRMTIETYRKKIAEVFERLQVANTSNWGGKTT